jgi:O-antigen ligase
MLRERVERVVIAVGMALSAVVAIRLVLGPQILMLGGNGTSTADLSIDGRPLPALGATLLAVAAAVQLSHWMRQAVLGRPTKPVWVLLATALAFTGQGTAIIAGFVGLVLVFALEKGPRSRLRFVIGSIALTSLLAGALIVHGVEARDWSGILPDSIVNNLYQRQENLGTRELLWNAALASYRSGSFVNQLIGWPTGSTPGLTILSRAWGHVAWSNAVHSMYVGTLLNSGAIGLGAYILIIAVPALSMLLSPEEIGRARSLGVLAILGIFSYTYSLSFEHALLIGASVAPFRPPGATQRRRSSL